ncbi:MAG: helix-turn-helix domain-containing protein [Planctomycetota bacterium]
MQHVRRPRAEYEALLDRKESEGLTYAELAEVCGVPYSSLIRWLPRVRREREHEGSSPFVELDPQSAEHASIEVVLATGHRLIVRDGFDASLLRQVVAVLGC